MYLYILLYWLYCNVLIYIVVLAILQCIYISCCIGYIVVSTLYVFIYPCCIGYIAMSKVNKRINILTNSLINIITWNLFLECRVQKPMKTGRNSFCLILFISKVINWFIRPSIPLHTPIPPIIRNFLIEEPFKSFPGCLVRWKFPCMIIEGLQDLVNHIDVLYLGVSEKIFFAFFWKLPIILKKVNFDKTFCSGWLHISI